MPFEELTTISLKEQLIKSFDEKSSLILKYGEVKFAGNEVAKWALEELSATRQL